MTAGLPKVLAVAIAVGIAVFGSAIAVIGQEVQTPSYTLPGAASIVEGSTALAPEDQAPLLDLLEEAGVGGYLTDEQAIAILGSAGLPDLAEGDVEGVAQVVAALTMVLNAINAETIDPEGALAALAVAMGEESPLDALAALLDEQASPPGVLNAIWNAALKVGYVQSQSATLLAQIEIAIQQGVPPGIVVRVAKDALRAGLSAEEQIALVAELLADGETSPGHAANAVTGKGKPNGQASASGKPDKPKKDNKGQGKKS